MTETWFFALDAGPLTPWEVEQLNTADGAGTVSLSPHPDGAIAAAVDADSIRDAFASARMQVDDAIGKRPLIVALHGALEGSVADVVYRAAAKLRIDETSILEAHLAELWYRIAYDMAVLGAIDEQHYGANGEPKRKLVTRPTPWNAMAPSEVMMAWDLTYAAAKGYIEGNPTDGRGARP